MPHEGRALAARLLLALLLTLAFVGSLTAGEPSLVAVQSAPGRFEIAAIDASAAHAVAAHAEEAWRVLAGPLGLPEAFSSPVFVRLVALGNERADAPRFHVTVEPGGVVSARMFGSGISAPVLRRALVQALLLRLAVAQHGVTERLTAPLWLEHACVLWWQTRADAAQLDALKQESVGAPPPMTALLKWRRGVEEPRGNSIGAVWLLAFLQAESGRAREWPAFLQRILGGDEPEAALAESFPGRFANTAERELWWQTGWHHARRLRTLPALEAEESRAQLGALARFVFAATDTEADQVVPLEQVLARAGEPIVATELARRAAEVARLVPALHPFYRNAGLSLAEALRDAAKKKPAQRAAACAAFEQDWRDALELEKVTKSALDALEAKARFRD